MKIKITGEEPFQVLAHSFAVSPSNEGYTLEYSADGISFTAIEVNTPAGEVGVYNDIAKGMMFRLIGNQSEVYINY